jgi:hypothetical protein
MKQKFTVPAWDDLRSPASAINPAGSAAAATVDQEDGGLIFANGAVQTIATWFQMPHAWKEGSDIYLHVHWHKLATGTMTGTVKWQTKYEWTNIGATRAGFSAFADGSESVPNSNIALKHAMFHFPVISGAGKTKSSMICVVLQRLSSGAGADTFGANAKLLEIDIHYQVDKFGSQTEY